MCQRATLPPQRIHSVEIKTPLLSGECQPLILCLLISLKKSCQSPISIVSRFLAVSRQFQLSLGSPKGELSTAVGRRLRGHHIFFISFLYSFLSISALYTRPITSASGNEAHESVTPPILMRIYASGRIPMSCLMSEHMRLYMP